MALPPGLWSALEAVSVHTHLVVGGDPAGADR